MFVDVRQALADALVDAGVTVTLDPSGLLPMVFVDLPDEVIPTGNALAGWTCVVPVWIVAPPPADTASADWLLDTLPVVLNTLQRSTARKQPFALSGKDCPAYRVDVTCSITNELC